MREFVRGVAGEQLSSALRDSIVEREKKHADEHGVWLHVDAAYGAFFVLTTHGRRVLAGIERSQTVVMDPHKGLFLPFGSGALIVRDERQLAEAHRYSADYLADARRGGVLRIGPLRGTQPSVPRSAAVAAAQALRPRAVPRRTRREAASRTLLARKTVGDATVGSGARAGPFHRDVPLPARTRTRR
jgi:glutamate/tyrosine decarboxylase-like PLP-dependent enzyme